jgi:hypothetical protein
MRLSQRRPLAAGRGFTRADDATFEDMLFERAAWVTTCMCCLRPLIRWPDDERCFHLANGLARCPEGAHELPIPATAAPLSAGFTVDLALAIQILQRLPGGVASSDAVPASSLDASPETAVPGSDHLSMTEEVA